MTKLRIGLFATSCLAGLAALTPAVAQTAQQQSSGIEVVTVTAEKKTESILNVPMGITALSGDDLVRLHDYRFEDFLGNIPGVSVEQVGGYTEIYIRGLTTGADLNSGTAIYVDDTPYLPSSTFASGALDLTDLDTYDMARIEVLKGPQGTLYGANAAGGLLKYVTNAPDPSGFAASVEAGAATTQNGGLGYDFHGMLNIPLADDLALRIVGESAYYSGFIKDPNLSSGPVDGAHVTGGRASLLWTPNQDLSVRFTAMVQDHKVNDYYANSEDVYPVTYKPIYGPLIQERGIAQPQNSFTYLTNLTVNYDVGFAKLTSSSSFHRTGSNFTGDESEIYGAYTPYYFGASYGVQETGKIQYETVAQELRLASEGDGPLQWLVGGYFTTESSDYVGWLWPYGANGKPLTNLQTISSPFAPAGLPFAGFAEPVTYMEYSGFANVDYHITPEVDFALGGRYAYNRQSYTEFTDGALFGDFTPGVPDSGFEYDLPKKSHQGVFTWSGDLRWHFTPDSMVYGRIATGFEPGGPDDVVPSISGLPSAYQSSTTTNYEVGIKSKLLDNRLTIQLDAYQIDWHSIIIALDIDGFGISTNAGTAHTRGVEWQFDYVPIDGLTLGFNGDYNYGAFTQVIPAVITTFGANVGSQLPTTPDWQGSLSAEYERPLFGEYSGFIGMNDRYTGGRWSGFVAAYPYGFGPREKLAGYNILDVRTGVESDKYSATLYVKNLTNDVVPTFVAAATAYGNLGPQDAIMSRPRTIGITLTAKF